MIAACRSFVIQSFMFASPATTTQYTVMMGRCTKNQRPTPPPAPQPADCNIRYAGQQVIGGQTCDCWAVRSARACLAARSVALRATASVCWACMPCR